MSATTAERLLGALTNAGERDAARLIEELLALAQPAIDSVIGYYRRRGLLEAHEVGETVSNIHLALLTKLQRIAGESQTIANFEGYVAGLAYNAVNDLFRARHPERARLKRQLRDAAMRDPRFATRMTENGIECRLVAPDAAARSNRNDAAAALERLLREAGHPLLLNDVVKSLAELWQTARPREVPEEEQADTAPTPLARLEQQAEIRLLWQEIRQLREPQRVALLLNMRGEDAGNALALFLLVGVATIDDLAQALGISCEELPAIWSTLPWDDRTIAERLGVTRQRVIDLRKSARERLSRRLRAAGKES